MGFGEVAELAESADCNGISCMRFIPAVPPPTNAKDSGAEMVRGVWASKV